MKPLDVTPDLLNVAKHIVWFKEPQETLADPIHFLAYAMKLGTVEDLIVLDRAGINLEHYSEVLDHAPPGVFDMRSWTYWNLRCGRQSVPPLPRRTFEQKEG